MGGDEISWQTDCKRLIITSSLNSVVRNQFFTSVAKTFLVSIKISIRSVGEKMKNWRIFESINENESINGQMKMNKMYEIISEEEIVTWLIICWLRIRMSTERPVFLIADNVVLCTSWHLDWAGTISVYKPLYRKGWNRVTIVISTAFFYWKQKIRRSTNEEKKIIQKTHLVISYVYQGKSTTKVLENYKKSVSKNFSFSSAYSSSLSVPWNFIDLSSISFI